MPSTQLFLAPLQGIHNKHQKYFWRRCRGGEIKIYPSRSHKLFSCIYFCCQLPLVFLSPTSHLPFPFAFLFCRFLLPLPFPFASFLACLCACLFVEVIMAEKTKLCDFSSTNNNDFISTPIAPATSAESYEINAALLNLVMKEQFSGLPSEDVASHLNTFIELCDM